MGKDGGVGWSPGREKAKQRHRRAVLTSLSPILAKPTPVVASNMAKMRTYAGVGPLWEVHVEHWLGSSDSELWTAQAREGCFGMLGLGS